jgi:uncharacterized protein YegP (UPF0339 family)
MATATKESRAARELARRARNVHVPESMRFVIFEDNGGAHHWRLVAGDGATLAQSGSFASQDDAERAARRVRDGAGSARMDRLDGVRAGLADHGDERSDDLDAERWLDESGGASSDAVTK